MRETLYRFLLCSFEQQAHVSLNDVRSVAKLVSWSYVRGLVRTFCHSFSLYSFLLSHSSPFCPSYHVITFYYISLRQDRIKSAKFERDLRTRLEVDKKTSREHLLKAKLAIEADFAEQLRELTDKCIAIQKQERRIEKGKKTKSVQAIERLEIQVAHSQGR